jgi:transposase
MNVHKNARLTPRGRERIVWQVESGQTLGAVAEAVGVCPRTVRKWVDRYHHEGLSGLQDRSSPPHRLHRPTHQTVIEEIERLRRQRWTGKQIAVQVGVSPATISRVLRRLGLNKLSALEPAEPIRRYEREHPGELIHLDIKKLGRIGSVGHRITGRQTGVVNRHLGVVIPVFPKQTSPEGSMSRMLRKNNCGRCMARLLQTMRKTPNDRAARPEKWLTDTAPSLRGSGPLTGCMTYLSCVDHWPPMLVSHRRRAGCQRFGRARENEWRL